MNYKILFAGSGEFGAAILEKLAESEFKPSVLITQPDKPVGRKQIPSPSRAKKIALKFGLKTYEPKSLKNDEAEKMIKSLEPDLLVVADYGKIIPKNILDIPKFGALNIHPSLLPRHRGATPIQHTILTGDKETGVTIILMDEQVDHGSIIENYKLQIENLKFSYNELITKLAKLGGDLLIKTLPQWLAGEIKPTAQDESKATYTKILTREDGKIDWQKSVEEIDRQIRAFAEWPGTWSEWEDGNKILRLKIIKAEIFKIDEAGTPGRVGITENGEMMVAAAGGNLKINELQLEGKNKISGREFLRGYQKISGATLL